MSIWQKLLRFDNVDCLLFSVYSSDSFEDPTGNDHSSQFQRGEKSNRHSIHNRDNTTSCMIENNEHQDLCYFGHVHQYAISQNKIEVFQFLYCNDTANRHQESEAFCHDVEYSNWQSYVHALLPWWQIKCEGIKEVSKMNCNVAIAINR